MSRKAVLNLDYALMQSTYWMFYAVAGIFVSVYMLGKGYSNTAIGLVIAVGNIAAVIVQSIIADITDRFDRISNITVIKTMTVVLFMLTAAVLLTGSRSAGLTAAYTALIVVHTALHPFINSLSFTLGESGIYVSFGIGRSMGSLSAAVLGLVMGYMVTALGVDVIPFSGLMILIAMEAVIIITGRHYKKQTDLQKMIFLEKKAEEGRTEHTEPEDTDISFIRFIKDNIRFVVMSVGVAALFFGNVILENFTIQIVENIGGNTEQMGIVIFVMSILEMPAMIFFDRLKRRFSYIFLLRIAAVFFAVKITMMYLARSMMLIYIAQINQILGYGLLFPAMVGFIGHVMTKGEAVRGQALFTTAITSGNVLGCIAGGRILDIMSVNSLLLISSAVTVLGTIIIWIMVRTIRCADKRKVAQNG